MLTNIQTTKVIGRLLRSFDQTEKRKSSSGESGGENKKIPVGPHQVGLESKMKLQSDGNPNCNNLDVLQLLQSSSCYRIRTKELIGCLTSALQQLKVISASFRFG